MMGERLDVALAEMLPDYSRSKITSWIKSGDASIDGRTFKPKDKASGFEIVVLNTKKKQTNSWIAENIPLNIVFEDEDIIVINKEYGLVTHPGAGNWNGTLANALLNYDPSLLDFLEWYKQLVSESLGKKGKGILPIISNMPKDNHSTMQLYLDGFDKNFFTFFFSKDNKSDMIIKKNLFDDYKFLKNKSINQIIHSQKLATEKVFINKKYECSNV